MQNEKQNNLINDTITVLVKVKLNKAFCDEADDATKVFSKGLKNKKRSDWKETLDITIVQKLVLTILKSANKYLS